MNIENRNSVKCAYAIATRISACPTRGKKRKRGAIFSLRHGGSAPRIGRSTKCATKTKKFPCFVTNLPTFSKKTSRFRSGFSGGTTKCSAFSRSSAQSARQGGEIHYISLALPPKSFIFAGKHLLRRPPCAALPHRYEETAVSPSQRRRLLPHHQ